MHQIAAIVSIICITIGAGMAQSPTDFSGEWKLNTGRSEVGRLPVPPDTFLKVEQSLSTVSVWPGTGERGAAAKSLLYPLDGRTEKRKTGDISYSTQTKWEGAAMLANTIVSNEGKNYTIMERWKLSSRGTALTIRRTIVDSRGEAESTLVYESPAAQRPTLTTTKAPSDTLVFSPGDLTPAQKQAEAAPERPTLAASTRPGPSRTDEDFVIASGTRILLRLRNAVDTKHSAAGDRVYLETAYPVYANQQLIIPERSYVMGTVVEAERAGKVKGKSSLNIRFDSVTLPNGVTRDFRSRVGTSDGSQVSEEGRIKGESGRGDDARTVATTTAAGAGIGTLAGAARGAPLKGLGIGSAVGAAAGLAGVLLSRGPDVILRPGTAVEMVLDRDIHFTADELTRWGR